MVTVLTGKVDVGQGSRTEVLMAAAEELRLPPEGMRALLADTAVTPNDGATAGSRTTPSTIPVVRRAAAAVREMLLQTAAEQWGLDRSTLTLEDGVVRSSERRMSYGDLARSKRLTSTNDASVPRQVPLTPVDEWRVLGKPLGRVQAHDVVTGRHAYPSDIRRPGMLYGAVLRAPSYGATLLEADLSGAAKLGATALRDGEFVGCAAPTSHAARKAVAAIAETARWKTSPQPSSDEIEERFRKTAVKQGEGRRGPRRDERGDPDAALDSAEKTLSATYTIPYIQHAPMEPRAAAAEWEGRKLTVWTGTQRPFGVQQQLMEAFRLPADQVRVIVPDTGGGFGGKHTGEVAIEAARLAQEVGKPVSLRWTREEEFAWAYFRPAGVFDIRGGVTGGKVVAWEFTNYNTGTAGIDFPYATKDFRTQYYPCDSPLRGGSYRGIAATGNNFAREAFVDELADAAEADPLEFRLENLDDERLKNVLKARRSGLGGRAGAASRAPAAAWPAGPRKAPTWQLSPRCARATGGRRSCA